MSYPQRRFNRSVIALSILASVLLYPETAYADAVRDAEWHLVMLQVDKAQEVTRGDGVVVAVIDSGVDSSHPDLLGNVLPGTDLVGTTDGTTDLFGHGTGMAGLIAGHGHSGQGVLGIAPDAKILPVRNYLPTNLGVPATYADGAFKWAADHGAKVINASFEITDTPSLRTDIEAALAKNVVIVASAGNKPTDNAVRFPAAIPGVVAVGGVDKKGNHDSTAVDGYQILISAPSTDIASTGKGGTYDVSQGTSDAAAIVAGVAALIRAKYPTMSAAEVVHRLTATATDKGPPGRDPEYGYGIVNPVAALTADVPPLPTATAATSAEPSNAQASPTGSGGLRPGLLAGLGVALLAVAVAGFSVVVTRGRRRR